MVNFDYFLDLEDGLDPTDPLGDIKFYGEDGSGLTLDSTFVDVWLVSIMNRFEDILQCRECEIKVLEEPWSLKVSHDKGSVVFKYRSFQTSMSRDTFLDDFISASERFVLELRKHDGADNNPLLSEIDKQVKKIKSNRDRQ